MKRADHRFNLPQNPGMANQILRYYDRNHSSFEHVSPKPDHEILTTYENNIGNALGKKLDTSLGRTSNGLSGSHGGGGTVGGLPSMAVQQIAPYAGNQH